jgi:menaquinone-dependent protoporphyrinogen oxidase
VALSYGGLTLAGEDQPVVELPEMTYGGQKMGRRILVAYASLAGSTAGVAEAIGKELADGGLYSAVDVKPMAEVTDLSPYSAVVAGSAIHGGRWLPEAMQFMQHNREQLQRKPFAGFLVCITLSMRDAGKYRAGLSDWLEPVRSLVKPVSEGYFAGALDFSKLPFNKDTLLMRLPVLFGAWKQGDHRDWAAIRAWAADLKPLLSL